MVKSSFYFNNFSTFATVSIMHFIIDFMHFIATIFAFKFFIIHLQPNVLKNLLMFVDYHPAELSFFQPLAIQDYNL